jgi:predicted MFS family arabinose efflux permease
VLAVAVALIVPLAATLADRCDSGAAQGGHSVTTALATAARNRSFHLLFWSYFVCGFQTAFILLHMPAFVVDAGFSANVGMAAVALIGLFNIFGTLLFGWCGGRWEFKQLLTVIYGARAMVILPLLWLPLSELGIYAFAAAMGLLWLATVPLTNALVGKVFGLRHMSMLSGLVFLGHQIGSFVGAWAGGAIFDRSGNYQPAWLIAIALSLIAALLCRPIDERPLLREATA